MTVNDVAEVRQISETQISPDGRRVAFVVQEPSVAANKTTRRVMVADFDSPTRASTVTTATVPVTNLGWTPDGSISFVAPLEGAAEVWKAPASGGRPRKVFDSPAAAVGIGGVRLAFSDGRTPPHDSKVLQALWSPDRRLLAFLTPQLVGPSGAEGIAYDDKTMGGQSIMASQYGTARVGVWVFDPRSGRSRALVDLDLGPQGRLGPTTRWSGDGKRLELSFGRQAWIVDVASGRLVDVPPSQPPAPPRVSSPDTFSAWSYAGDRAAAVRENRGTPPRLVVIDGSVVREGFDPNGWFAGVRFQQPVLTEWVDAHGHKAGGYRIVPPECEGKRCPAVVITHGYDAVANRFMYAGHEWQYPSQVFAANGFVVLGVDESHAAPGGPGRDWDETLRNLLEPVAMMEAAVKSGVDGGYVDPGRVGIAGYSRGAEVAQLALAHSSVFKAASTGDGGSGTIGYWFFGAQAPGVAERAKEVFGGSPVDPAAVGRWTEYAADLRADKINAPLLFQTTEGTAIAALPLRAYLKARDVPTELTIFPGETHNFHQPGHRAAAMNQNLTWFAKWLG